MRALISMRLRRDGYDLVEAESGYALFAALTEVRERESPMPSVIVSDIRMPGINGLAVLRAIREYGWRVPVILITYATTEDAVRRALAAVKADRVILGEPQLIRIEKN